MNWNWKYLAIGIGVVVIVGGGFLFLNSEFMKRDSCLDQGGAWDEEKQECIYEQEIGNQEEINNSVEDSNISAPIAPSPQSSEPGIIRATGNFLALEYTRSKATVESFINVNNKNTGEHVTVISLKDIEREFNTFWGGEIINDPSLIYMSDVMHDTKHDRFILVMEYTPYSGATGNAEWHFFIYDEHTMQLQAVTEIGYGYIPREPIFSPEKTKLAYITGGTGGSCARGSVIRGLDLETLKAINFESAELATILNGHEWYGENSAGHEKYASNLRWKDESTVVATFGITLCFSDDSGIEAESLPDQEFEFIAK